MNQRDDFYLPEETIEWLGLKKSEYLSVLIEKQKSGDFNFADYSRFDHLLPQTIGGPDRSCDEMVDSYQVRTYVRTYQEQEYFHQLVIGALIPDQQGADIFVPIIAFVTRDQELVRFFTEGRSGERPPLN